MRVFRYVGKPSDMTAVCLGALSDECLIGNMCNHRDSLSQHHRPPTEDQGWARSGCELGVSWGPALRANTWIKSTLPPQQLCTTSARYAKGTPARDGFGRAGHSLVSLFRPQGTVVKTPSFVPGFLSSTAVSNAQGYHTHEGGCSTHEGGYHACKQGYHTYRRLLHT